VPTVPAAPAAPGPRAPDQCCTTNITANIHRLAASSRHSVNSDELLVLTTSHGKGVFVTFMSRTWTDCAIRYVRDINVMNMDRNAV